LHHGTEGTSLQKKTKEPNPALWIEASSEVVVLLAISGGSGGSGYAGDRYGGGRNDS